MRNRQRPRSHQGDDANGPRETFTRGALAATGVPLRAGLAQQSVDLLAPGAVYGDRVNVVDMRFAKVLRIRRTRLNVGIDLYNLLNANAPTTFESVYDPATNGARWMQPTAVLNARAARFNVQLEF